MYLIYPLYGLIIAPLVVAASLVWLMIALFGKEGDEKHPASYEKVLDADRKEDALPRKRWKLPFLLFAGHLLVNAVYEKYERFAESDQYVTSSGDFGIQVAPMSQVLGFAAVVLFVFLAWLILAQRVRLKKWFSIIALSLSLFCYYQTMQVIVCGTNGMRWYDWHFAGARILGERSLFNYYIGHEDCESCKVNEFTLYEIRTTDNDIVFERKNDPPYKIRKSLLIWWFDESQLTGDWFHREPLSNAAK
jgi:hypothetical protein